MRRCRVLTFRLRKSMESGAARDLPQLPTRWTVAIWKWLQRQSASFPTVSIRAEHLNQLLEWPICSTNFNYLIYRHIHCDTSGECPRLWLVPSQAVLVRGPVLDGRFNGNDNSQCARTGTTLWLGHYTVSTGAYDHRGFLGHDAKLNVLGAIKRSLWTETGMTNDWMGAVRASAI